MARILIGTPHGLLGQSAVPLSLNLLGMGLAEYGIRSGWREAVAITSIKLVVQPLVVWARARLLGLPPTGRRRWSCSPRSPSASTST